MAGYYTYKETNYICKDCGWSGTGEQARHGESFRELFELECPNCGYHIDLIGYPLLEEMLKYGSAEDKKSARKSISFIERVKAMKLKSADELPDIDADEIIITIKEEEKENSDDDAYIVLYWNNQELWREIRTYEYYERYIEIGEILKEKYGKRLIDFIPPENCFYWGGDRICSLDVVLKFRKSLSNNNDMPNAQFYYITKTGEFWSRRSMYDKAIEFAYKCFAKQGCVAAAQNREQTLGVISILQECGIYSDYIYTIAALQNILSDTEITKEKLEDFLLSLPAGNNTQKIKDIILEVELLTNKDVDTYMDCYNKIFASDSTDRVWSRENGAVAVTLAKVIYEHEKHISTGNHDTVSNKIRETVKYIVSGFYNSGREHHNNYDNLFMRFYELVSYYKIMKEDD